MKKKLLLPLSLLLLSSVVSCNNNDNKKIDLSFENNEYQIRNGEAVTVETSKKGIEYEIVNNPYKNVISINEKTGELSFNDSIPNYTQIMVIAKYKDQTSSPCIVTLCYDYQASEVNFTNKSNYIVNGQYANATSSKNYSVVYELKEKVDGISIESQTGKINFAPIVQNNTKFIVVADSHGSKIEKEFIAMTEGFVSAITSRQAIEKGDTKTKAIYPLDFTKSDVEEEKVVAVVTPLNEPIDEKYYSFDKNKKQLIISGEYANTLNIGENILKVITERNTIEIRLDLISKFISTPEDLASINNDEESLSGYYILMNDIDLTTYLSESGKGYNEGKGWTPIGLYKDTLDTTIATQFSFKGTFDGNGHVVRGLYSSRKDEASFNAGLFGYITSSATIKNLGVEGSLTVSSYSGGLVGSNNGIVENCWADVDMNVSSGEDAYRYVGGFVGNNFGTIKNCYSLGTVLCDREFGSFVGSNTGFLDNCVSFKNEDCPSFIGFGSLDKNCFVLENLDAMKSFNWNEVFPNEYWDFKNNDYPSLKGTLEEYNLRGITLNIEDTSIFRGDKITLDASILPAKYEEEYKDEIIYEVIGEGYYVIGNSINTLNAVDTSVTIKASLIINGEEFSDEKTIFLSEKIESLVIEHELDSLEAGKRYLLEATCTPNDTNDKVAYHLNGKYVGASIVDNILTINDEFNLSSISFYAISESGTKSNIVTLPVIKQLIVDSGVATTYENENKNLEFTFNNSIDLTNAKVEIFGKEVEYQKENNTIIINKSLLEDAKDYAVRVIFELNDVTVYAADAYYFSHQKYTRENIEGEVIEIHTVEDFFKYFNADVTGTYDQNKINNYSKTFVLMNDLDFGGKELYSIGFSGAEFSGIFYGNGHTISNFTIMKNEEYALGEINSSYYGVGLFSIVSGSVYDLTIADATIDGKNFVGGVVGMLTTGHIENCQGTNLKVTASEYQYSADEIVVSKIVGKNYTGSTLCLYYENSSLNTIG